MANTMHAVLSLFVLMATGCLVGKLDWINQHSKAGIGKVASSIAVPATIFNSITTSFTREGLASAGKDVLAPLLSVGVLFVLCFLIGKYVLRLRWGRLGTFYAISGSNNTIFIGLSIVSMLYPDYAAYSVYYFLAVTIFFWTAGTAGMQRDAGGQVGISAANVIKNLFSLHVIAMIFALAVVLLGMELPAFLRQSIASLGGMSTPLCLIYSGYTIYEMVQKYGLKALGPDRDTLAVYAIRFILSPMMMLLFCVLFGIGGTGRAVLIVMASLPTMSQSVIMSGAYGGDEEFAAKAYLGSTLLCLVVIPVYFGIFAGS